MGHKQYFDVGKADNLRAWVKDLRETTAEQCTGALHALSKDGSSSFCCLGRACEVAIAAGVKMPIDRFMHERPGGYDGEYGQVVYCGLGSSMPTQVSEWLGFWGLNASDPMVRLADDCDTQHHLSGVNDVFGMTFPQIADVIEENFLPEDWAETLRSRA